MEWLAQKQPEGARWEENEHGYHLRSAAPLGTRKTPWLLSAGLLVAGLWALGLFLKRNGAVDLWHLTAFEFSDARVYLMRGSVLAGILLLAAAAFWLGSLGPAPSPANAGLLVSHGKLDFGEVWENSDFRWTLPLENPTAKAIEIVGFETRWGPGAVEPASQNPMSRAGPALVQVIGSLLADGVRFFPDRNFW